MQTYTNTHTHSQMKQARGKRFVHRVFGFVAVFHVFIVLADGERIRSFKRSASNFVWLIHFSSLFSSVCIHIFLKSLFCFLRFTCVLVLLHCYYRFDTYTFVHSPHIPAAILIFIFFFATKAFQIDRIYAFHVL